jgi:hypothetical protein
MYRPTIRALLLLALAACSSGGHATPPSTEPLQSTAGPTASEADPNEPETTDRCLPVVAADCGCVYDCGVGTLQPNGLYSVTHSFWGTTPITARIDEWCADGACTEAFFGNIVCDGICAPKPANSTCHFEGDACVSAR